MAARSTRWRRGVLPIALGEATKLSGRMLDADKAYEFTIAFGAETDTLDLEGNVIATSDKRPTLAEVEAVLPRFTGEIEQVPPAYSALKVDGKRAYDLARAGEEVALKSRRVMIHSLRHSRQSGNPAGGSGGEKRLDPRFRGDDGVDTVTSDGQRLQGHLYPLARPRHRPRARHRRPCHHVAADEGRALHPRCRDFAGQIGGSR